MKLVAAAVLLLAMTMVARSADAAPTPPYATRADGLLRLLKAPGEEDAFFSTLFLDAVPVDQWRALASDLRARHGAPVSLGAVTQTTASAGQVEIRYERATVGFSMVIAPTAPHRVVGLHVVGVRVANDSLRKVAADLATLPGTAGFAIVRLDAAGPVALEMRNETALLATGSSFKLYILAEAVRARTAGERRWNDVISLDHKSFSGRLADWPDISPMTLHSLATEMIAESDNSAADTLLYALGRANVDAMVEKAGHEDPARTLPILSTVEAFALKAPDNQALRSQYATASPDRRLALLTENAAALTAEKVDVGSVAEAPVAIDSIEWFASPVDMIRLLDWLRRNGGAALPILAVNPGIAQADAKRWRYLGYKGGSEPGVLAMNFLAQHKNGQWYALSASWNNSAARVDEPRFIALMTRMLNLLSD